MKKAAKMVIFTLILTICFGMMTSCGVKQKHDIKNVIEEFEDACNKTDVEAILNTVDPKISDMIKLALGVYGMFSEQDTGEILARISNALVGDSELDGNDFFSSIQIDVREVFLEEDNAVAKAEVQYMIAGNEYRREAEFECMYYLEEWYISSLKLN